MATSNENNQEPTRYREVVLTFVPHEPSKYLVFCKDLGNLTQVDSDIIILMRSKEVRSGCDPPEGA